MDKLKTEKFKEKKHNRVKRRELLPLKQIRSNRLVVREEGLT